MTTYLVRRADGQYLVRDDEFTPDEAKACHFTSSRDAWLCLANDETVVPSTHEIDGYTWEEFKAMMNTDPLPQNARPGTEYWQRAHDTASFRAPDGARVTLHKDGTWSVDCAPDWNGAS